MLNTDRQKLREKIVDQFNLTSLSEEEQWALVDQLEENLIKKINLLILDRLTPEERVELEGQESDEAVERYLKEKIFDLDNVKIEAASWIINDWQKRLISSV